MDRSKWEYKKLGDISVFLTGCRPKGGVAQIKEGVHSLGGEHIGKDGYVDLSSPKFVPESFFINNKGHIKDNDILLCKDGALSGKVAIVRGELNDTKAMVNEHVFIIRSDSLLHKYLFYYLFSPTGQYQLKLRISGAAQGGINGANLSTIIVPYPKDVSLQQRIVAELDCLNEMIALKQGQLKEFDKLAQSIFYDMFGDPLINDKEWEKFSLSRIGIVTTGNTPSRKVEDYYNKEYVEWIKTDNFDKASLYPSQAKEYLSESGARVGRIVEAGSLLVTCIAGSLSSIGGVCITDRKVAFNQQINAITPNKNVNYIFLYHLIKNSGSFIRENATNGMKHIITKSTFEKLHFPLPPLAMQQQFADKISAIEAQKELVKKSITETQQLLDSRMDYYFD